MGKKDRILNPYIGSHLSNAQQVGAFRCPVDGHIINRITADDRTKGMDCFEYFGNSYPMNQNLLWYTRPGHPSTDKYPVVLKYVQIPHHLVILTGDAAWLYFANDDQWAADWHRQYPYINLVFLDGHAARTEMVPDHRVARTQDYSIGIRYEQDPKPDDERADA
jgi:prepilin-type processing-associated H-X9-DG protein